MSCKVVLVFVYFCGYSGANGDTAVEQIVQDILGIISSEINGTEPSGRQYRPPPPYYRPYGGPNLNINGALNTITRYDELECIPRLLCEAAAGGTPGSSRQINFDVSSLSTLLSYISPDTVTSPMMVFGKAALLGVSNRGDPYQCIQSYPKCPRDQYRLLYYLNNHRGGIFRLFNMDADKIQDGRPGQDQYYQQKPFGYNQRPYQQYIPQGAYQEQVVHYPIRVQKGLNYDGYLNRYDPYDKNRLNLYQNYIGGDNPEIYAKKYKHSSLLFKNDFSFPKEQNAEARILNNPYVYQIQESSNTVAPDQNKFVFSLGLSPNEIKTEDKFYFSKQHRHQKQLSYQSNPNFFETNRPSVTDRLPALSFFPEREDIKPSSFFPY